MPWNQPAGSPDSHARMVLLALHEALGSSAVSFDRIDWSLNGEALTADLLIHRLTSMSKPVQCEGSREGVELKLTCI